MEARNAAGAIVCVADCDDFEADIDCRSNAYLIAAAPDLLEALEILVDQACETYPHFESLRGQKNIKKALEVIKKAKGLL